jgi:hypothetical protein
MSAATPFWLPGSGDAATWAFEPDQGTTGFLRRNIEINDLNGLVTVFELVLGPTAGRVALTLGLGPPNRVAGDDDVNYKRFARNGSIR